MAEFIEGKVYKQNGIRYQYNGTEMVPIGEVQQEEAPTDVFGQPRQELTPVVAPTVKEALVDTGITAASMLAGGMLGRGAVQAARLQTPASAAVDWAVQTGKTAYKPALKATKEFARNQLSVKLGEMSAGKAAITTAAVTSADDIFRTIGSWFE